MALRKPGAEYVVDETTGCWVWQFATTAAGYGVRWQSGRVELAHRMYYEQAQGSVPDGHDLDHLCRNPPCVNPAHLEAVSHAENCRRGAIAKLDWEKVRAIRASSEPCQPLADRYGVTRATISSVRHHRTWREEVAA